ncbi:MAG TPA: beta-L-arabinofuranosidase domain-containing protein [Vicinamibacterales bacterium]|nr:beta-L-arabinofuranosidase domain-containing protein [Vicinamibacterales bacterium]
MSRRILRREFLKTGSMAAGALAATRIGRGGSAQTPKPSDVRISTASYRPVADYPIQPKRYSDVTLKDDFWKPKVALNAEVTIPFEVRKLSEGGRGLGGGVLEASILSLATHPNPALQAQVDARIRAMSQAPDSGNRGFEIAATYFQVTGKRDLLDNAIKAAEALYTNFKTNNPPFSGGERDATNCIQLYRVTQDRKHLDLAKHYLDIRGLDNSVNRSRHNQSYKPVLEQTEAVGHAVNCVTLMVSLADVGVLTGLKEYFNAAHRMWTDAVERKMYITGGVGTTGNEGFGDPYSLPNIDAYAETCAVLMFVTLNHRLFLATGDARYIDVLERGMYNNAIDGVSASGNRFFYVNRLASAGDGRDLRWERASLECCPPNLVRFLASMPGYIYAQDPKGAIYVNLYVSSETRFTAGGKALALSVQSEMPWGGKSSITMASADRISAPIKLRMPGWTRNQPVPGGLYAYAEKSASTPTVSVNGRRVSVVPDRMGYVTVERQWNTGDVIEVNFPIEVRRVVADRRVKENRGRVAIERGPIVYCAEWPEVEDGKALDLRVDARSPLTPSVDKNLFGGVTVIQSEARRLTRPSLPERPVKMIPYYVWANRGPGEMAVWLSTVEYAMGDVGPAGGFIFYDNPNHAKDGWRYLEAAPFDQSAGARWGCFRQLIAGARGTAVGTGKQNTADMLAACAEPGTAAHLCANLTLNGVRGWFLPSRDELALMYRNLRTTGAAHFQDTGLTDNFTYWTSSQNTADMAAHVDFADLGRLHGDDKDFPRRVRAIRAF